MATSQDSMTPEAVDAERALLGSILVDPNPISRVLEILPPPSGTWFYTEEHRLIFSAFMTLFERSDPIDLETVTDVLRRRGSLEKIGGSVYLAELTERAFTTANTAHHARIIRDKALYRGIINIATDLKESAYTQEDLPELINRTQQSLLQISGAQTTASFSVLRDILTDTIRNAQHADDLDLTGVNTGFHQLNNITSGFQNSNLVIVAARPSQGKSALALQFALSGARSLGGLPVVIFSLEMSREELGMRILCSEARVDSQRMKRGFLAREEWGLIFNAGSELENLPILIDDTSSLSVLDILTRSKRLQSERGLGMIVIDYLQLMNSAGKRKENRQQEVSDISRNLKILAKELNVPVIALSQLSREVEHKSPPRPVLSDLRDSGAIEQDADMVIFIYRGDIYEPNKGGIAELIVAKQRNGPTGSVGITFNNTFARFDDLNGSHHERPERESL